MWSLKSPSAGVATAPPGVVPYTWDKHVPCIPLAVTKWVLAKPRAFSFLLQEQEGCYKQSWKNVLPKHI